MSDTLVERAARAMVDADERLLAEMGCKSQLRVNDGHRQYARAAIAVVRAAVIEECARAAVDAINSCREDGESDLRAARARAEQAIRALKEKTP